MIEITTHYNQGMQNTISEHTTHRVEADGLQHRVLLLSAKNRKRRLQFAQAHQNWTIEDLNNFSWSDESRFLLRHSDDRVRISTLNSSGWWWWCNGMGDIFFAHLVPIEHSLKATAYLSIVADHVHPFMTTVYLSSDGYFQQDNAPWNLKTF